MARKRKPRAAVEGSQSQPLALQMRGSAEWKEWVEELADFDRTNVSETTDRALALYARHIGFPKAPPKR